MTLIIILLISYIVGMAVCRLTAIAIGGAEGDFLKNIANVPIINFLFIIVIAAAVIMIVRNFRKLSNKDDKNKV